MLKNTVRPVLTVRSLGFRLILEKHDVNYGKAFQWMEDPFMAYTL